MSPPSRVAIVGASLAGVRTARALRREGFTGVITLIGAEDELPYDRPPLSKSYLTNDVAATKPLAPAAFYDDLELHLGTSAVALRPSERAVVLADGRTVVADAIVITTGAAARSLPGLAPDDRTFVLRTRSDADRLRAALGGSARVLVIGAGFIGCEVAATARERGLDVTLIDPQSAPLVRGVGSVVGATVAAWHRSAGVDVRLGVTVTATEDSPGDRHVTLSDGTTQSVDVIVVGVGADPATGWLEGSGLTIANGLNCDALCRVGGGGGHVWAAGDVASWPSTLFRRRLRLEHWTNAAQQAACVARGIVHGHAAAAHKAVPYIWSDQHGRKLQIVGLLDSADTIQLLDGHPEDGAFVAGGFRNGELCGAALVGRARELGLYEALIAARTGADQVRSAIDAAA